MSSTPHILIVNTRHYQGGGDSTYAFNLAALLRSRGHRVSFFAMQDERNLPDPNSDLFVSHIDFRVLNRRKTPVAGLKVLTRSIYSVEARKKFSQLIDRVKPDIIHLQNIHAHITPSVIFEAWQRNIPVVWTLHDYKLICPNSHLLIDQTHKICEACRGGHFYWAVIQRCKKNSLLASSMAMIEAYAHRMLGIRDRVSFFLCPSRFMREQLVRNGFPASKLYHLPLFIPNDGFNYQESHRGYFLFLGRLEPIKGVKQLLEAARRVPQIRIKIAGRAEEPYRSEWLQSLPDNVEYLGVITGEELKELRGHAMALVCPSICYENQPLSILEMFATGKPVIASNIGGMRELIGDNERGWLVEPGDAEQLAKVMLEVASNRIEYLEKSQKAYQYAHDQHSEQAHYSMLAQIYSSVV